VIPDILNRLKELEKKARKGVFVPWNLIRWMKG
jgi:hypothetical protein